MDSRQQFETSSRFRGMDFTRSKTHPEYYESPYANGAWEGWQASLKELYIDPKWARMDQSFLIDCIRSTTNFDADMIDRMIQFAVDAANRDFK